MSEVLTVGLTKKCVTCKKVQDVEVFPRNKDGKYGRHSKCRICYKQYRRDWYLKNKVRHRAKMDEWLETGDNKEKYRAYQRARHLSKTFGLTVEDYDALAKAQNGVCAICKKPETDRPLAVDHDHETNEVRGLLCKRCNIGLGNLYDSVETLQSAIEYLQKRKSN